MHQHIGEGREVQPQLVGTQRLRTHAVGEQAELLLDAVLHLATSAIESLIQFPRWPELGTQRSDHEARVLAFGQILGLGHYPPRLRPTRPRSIGELAEYASRLKRALVLAFRLGHRRTNFRFQALIA